MLPALSRLGWSLLRSADCKNTISSGWIWVCRLLWPTCASTSRLSLQYSNPRKCFPSWSPRTLTRRSILHRSRPCESTRMPNEFTLAFRVWKMLSMSSLYGLRKSTIWRRWELRNRSKPNASLQLFARPTWSTRGANLSRARYFSKKLSSARKTKVSICLQFSLKRLSKWWRRNREHLVWGCSIDDRSQAVNLKPSGFDICRLFISGNIVGDGIATELSCVPETVFKPTDDATE